MNGIFRHIIWLTFIFNLSSLFGQQKIGVVLSGGGATAFAHIGVLKALEEKGVPIHYITGTSAGALIGALYAAGYSPKEIEAYVLTDAFQLMSKGKLTPEQKYLYKVPDTDASMFSFAFSKDSILKKSLPTNFITSAYLDFEMLKLLGPTSISVNNNFDSLMVPFRCLASDIVTKKSVVFKEGNLNLAVRASMNYPFYLNPIRVDGKLLFDGGLYNNFPANVMYDNFPVDFIIGSNVSYNASPPMEDDLVSQLTNMLVSATDFTLPCEYGIMINPQTDVSTFDFESIKKAIDVGYQYTLKAMDSICVHVTDKISQDSLAKQRAAFRNGVKTLKISSIGVTCKYKHKLSFINKSLLRDSKKEEIDFKKLEKRYYRLYSSPQIDFLYPTLQKKGDSTYQLNVEVRKNKDFKVDVGGHFSSRAVNTGYIGLSYRSINKIATITKLESYFGKFYGSVKGSFNMDFPAIFPVDLQVYFTLNRWDYFRSFATFFEDVKPSFLVQNELYYGIQFKHPITNSTKSTFDARMFMNEDDYYQTDQFTNKDTSDYTTFRGGTFSWKFEQNTLNRKQFANSGHYFAFKIRYVNGREHNRPGSTGINKDDIYKNHQWLNLSVDFQSFLIDHSHFHLGLHGTGAFNTQSLFSNYTSSVLAMTAYSPLPDMETYFFKEYRSPQFAGAGINLIYTFYKNFDVRLDGYFYQPFVKIQQNIDGTFGYSKLFKGTTYVASASFIYQSFLGPLRATLNYFPLQTKPLSFQISFGYVLFNERAYR